MFKRGSLKKRECCEWDSVGKIWKIKKGRYGKQKREDMENKKGNPFLKGFPFCEVSSGVEPLYTVLQTVT